MAPPPPNAAWPLARPPPPPLPRRAYRFELSVEEECEGWRNGTLDTWSDPKERRQHDSSPGGFTSQNGQDRLLWEHLFARLRRRGRYLDVAANHHKRISNTYFLDRCAGWAGVCVEPNPIYHAGLRTHRSCRLVPTCISDAPRETTMLLPPYQWLGGLGGVGNGSLPNLLAKTSIRSWYPPRKWQHTRLNCTTLELELRAARRLDGRWDHVDLLSLDVEGHEESVLRGVDWTRVRIDHILCERACEAVLRPMGYVAAKLPPSPGKRISEVTEVLWTRPGLPRVAFPRRQG